MFLVPTVLYPWHGGPPIIPTILFFLSHLDIYRPKYEYHDIEQLAFL